MSADPVQKPLYVKALEAALIVCMVLMVVLVFGNVVLRYGFNSGIAVSEEVSRLLFVWLTFLGAVLAMREKAHLGVDTLVRKLSPVGRRACAVTSQLLMLACCCPLDTSDASDEKRGICHVGRRGF